jgi:hypothetical protein
MGHIWYIRQPSCLCVIRKYRGKYERIANDRLGIFIPIAHKDSETFTMFENPSKWKSFEEAGCTLYKGYNGYSSDWKEMIEEMQTSKSLRRDEYKKYIFIPCYGKICLMNYW